MMKEKIRASQFNDQYNTKQGFSKLAALLATTRTIQKNKEQAFYELNIGGFN